MFAGTASHHEPFKSLSPIDWAAVPADGLDAFLGPVVANVATLVDSVPTTCSADRFDAAPEQAATEALRKEWKEVRVSGENPIDASVFRLAANDGQGTWFARRSVHTEFSFDAWALGLEREFAETLQAPRVAPGPRGNSVRGIGAERLVESRGGDGVAKLEVLHLSAQFPGPTSPRDFVVLLVMSDAKLELGKQMGSRQFVVVSRPCTHPDCPPRQGYIRGRYESVEVIREIPVPSLKTSRNRSASSAAGSQNKAVKLDSVNGSEGQESSQVASSINSGESSSTLVTGEEATANGIAVEWLMITRSDPGGSVPRFMVEKGMPGGMVKDAGKFVKWLSLKSCDDLYTQPEIQPSCTEEGTPEENMTADEGRQEDLLPEPATGLPQQNTSGPRHEALSKQPASPATGDEDVPSSGGIYGMITAAIGSVGTAVATRLLQTFEGGMTSPTSLVGTDSPWAPGDTKKTGRESQQHEPDDDSSSDTSSARSFRSVPEADVDVAKPDSGPSDAPPQAAHATENVNLDETATLAGSISSAHEKELRKLEEKRRKADEKLRRLQERTEVRQKDQVALSRTQEKYERELARHEAKYRREVLRLQERRQRAEERQKSAETEAAMERLRIERDMARTDAQMLRDQVGRLQRENTMLVTQLGRLGVVPTTSDGGKKD